MSMKTKIILILGLIAFGYYYWQNDRPVTHEGKGQIAKEQPKQTLSKEKEFKFGDSYTVHPLADFDITARVLSKKRYYMDKESELAPVDLALGWGPMSDDTVLSKLKISQRNRWFYWKCDSYPIPRNQIEHNAANMHLIPADNNIEKLIKSVNAGNLVHLKGHLVKVTKQGGWNWQSSLARDDTGNGSCEVVFVKEFKILL